MAKQEKAPIRLPGPDDQLLTPSSPLGERVSDIESLIKTVLIVVVVSVAAMILAAVVLVIEEFHFNNQTYREQSTNLQSQINTLQTEINVKK